MRTATLMLFLGIDFARGITLSKDAGDNCNKRFASPIYSLKSIYLGKAVCR